MEENIEGKQNLIKPERFDIIEEFPTHILERIEAECFQVAMLDKTILTLSTTEDFHIKQWSKVFDEYLFSAIHAYLPYLKQGQTEDGLILALQYFRHMTHLDSQAEDPKTYFKYFVLTILKLLYPDTNSKYSVRMHREHPFLNHLVQHLSGDFI